MRELKQTVIVARTPDLAARRVCAWVNGPGVKVQILSISQLSLADGIYTTIFWESANSGLGFDKSNRKSWPKVGERRLKRQPLKIDKLPRAVHDAIVALRNKGEIWQEISRRSSLPFSANWRVDGGGFVNWEAVAEGALKGFPRRRIPHTNLLRWFDLRVEQRTGSYEKP